MTTAINNKFTLSDKKLNSHILRLGRNVIM